MKIRKEIGKAFFVGILIFIVVGVIEYLNGWEISSGKELVIRFVINQVYSVSLYMANAFFFYFIITRYKVTKCRIRPGGPDWGTGLYLDLTIH